MTRTDMKPTETEARRTSAFPGSTTSTSSVELAREAELLRLEEPWKRTGRNAVTLMKAPGLRVVLGVLGEGVHMTEHKVEGRATIQTLTGHLVLGLPAGSVDLPTGSLAVLPGGVLHDLRALECSTFLITITASADPSDN